MKEGKEDKAMERWGRSREDKKCEKKDFEE